ncbi:PQQ-binding-like beta-propeller repeat protein [Dactylosporangium sp. NPDC051541]|uniref:outer membrane protein assembly factor BamB family protein n=1 Tax=Dactylosporangium sp. NPDC051541 TaxID=3363977 RepID=UPI0037A54B36
MRAGRGRWFAVLAAALVAVAAVVVVVALRRSDPAPPAASGPSPYPTAERLCADACDTRGTIRWSVPLPGAFVDNGRFVFPAGTGEFRVAPGCSRKVGAAYYLWAGDRLLAYDAATGRLRWTAAVPFDHIGDYCLLFADAQHVMVVAAGDKDRPDRAGVVAAADGRAIGGWDAPYPHSTGNIATAGAFGLAGDRAVWLSLAGEVSAVDLATGQRRWATAVTAFAGYHGDGPALFLDEFGTGRLEQLQRLDLATGALTRVRLSAPVGANGRLWIGHSFTSPYDGLPGVLLATSDDSAAAISTVDGTVLWRVVTGRVRAADKPYAQQLREIDAVAEVVYVEAENDNQVRAVAARTGAQSEAFGTAGIKGWSVLDGVSLDTGTVRGGPGLVGADPRTREIRWQVPGPPSFSSAADDAAAPRVVVGYGCAGAAASRSADGFRPCTAPVLLAVNV